MREISFSLKRIYRSRLLSFALLLAICIAAANIWYTTSQAVVPPADVSSVRTYPNLLHFVYPPSDAEVMKMDGYRRYRELIEQTAAEDPGLSTDLYAYALEAIALDRREISDDHLADLNYGLFFADYLEKNQYFEEYYSTPSALFILRKGSPVLFGFVPLLLFFSFASRLVGEDFQAGYVGYHRSLPLRHRRHIFGIFLSLILLALLYIALVSGVTLLASRLMKIPFGRLDYPLRLYTQNAKYLTTGAFLLKTLALFLLRTAWVIAMGGAVSNITRRVSTAIFSGCLLLSFSYLLSEFLPSLQISGNPVFINAETLFLGKRLIQLDPSTNRVLGFYLTGPQGAGLSVSVLIILTAALTALALSGPYIDQWRNGRSAHILTDRLHSDSPLLFEWKKLQSILSLSNVLGLILLITLVFFAMLAFRDQSRINIFRAVERAHSLEKEIALLEKEIRDFEDSPPEWAKDNQQEKQNALDHLKRTQAQKISSLKKVLNVSRAYDEKDSSAFYTGIQQDIVNKFGKGEITSASSNQYVGGAYPSNFSYRVSSDRNDYFIEHQIEPIFDVSYLPTIYDKKPIVSDQVVEYMKSQPANHSFFIIIFRLFHYYRMDWILLILFIVFFGSGFSTDFEYGIAWMLTLPRARSRFILEKLSAAISLCFAVFCVFLLILFAASFVTDGIGPWNYPVLQYLKPVEDAYAAGDFEGSFVFLPLATVMVRTWLLFLTQLTCLLSLAFVVSTWKTTPVTTAAITLLLSAGGHLASRLFEHPLWALTPFAHFDAVRIVSGIHLVETGQRMLQFLPSFAILAGWSCLFLILTNIRMTGTRDLL